MKVYFTASIVGKRHYLTEYKRIVAELEKRGCEVLAQHILDHTESQIRMETKDERKAFHRQLERWICGSDCMVVEASFPSISVGYEISLGLQRNKPVLVLYSEGDPPSLLSRHDEEKLVCERYSTDKLPEIIAGFLGYVTGGADLRFTFYLTAIQMAHLEQKARAKRVPKAVYLRGLIDEDRQHR